MFRSPPDMEPHQSSVASSQEVDKSKAYRAKGFLIDNREEILKILGHILKDVTGKDNKIRLRVVAPTVGEENKSTAVFCFEDKTPRKECEGSHRYPESFSRDHDRYSTYITIDSHFKGLTILHASPDTTVDLVVLHGIGRGHAWGSFMDPASEYMWLVDSLPKRRPEFRIVTYGFDTKVHGSDSEQDLQDLASQFRTSLRGFRAKPTISFLFLAHSLGGLVVKQAMVDMKVSDLYKDRENFDATRGMYFFGVPNDGMNTGPLKRMIHGQSNEEFVMSLGKNSNLLRNLAKAFFRAYNYDTSQIISFFETKRSPISVYDHKTKRWSMTSEEKVVLVDQASATHGSPTKYDTHRTQGLDLDHPNLVRFTPLDHNYQIVAGFLDHWENYAASMGNQGNSAGGPSRAWKDAEDLFSNRRASRPPDTWHNLCSTQKAFLRARQLLSGLDDTDCEPFKVAIRLTTIECEMGQCHQISSTRRKKHLQAAENYCDEARVIASRSPSSEGALEEVGDCETKIRKARKTIKEKKWGLGIFWP